MATIINRSNYIVSVRNREDLTRSFPHDKSKQAQAHLTALVQQGFRPQLKQLDDSFFVRIRDKGYRPQSGMFDSLNEADRFIRMVELDRAKGLDIDYLKARSSNPGRR